MQWPIQLIIYSTEIPSRENISRYRMLPSRIGDIQRFGYHSTLNTIVQVNEVDGHSIRLAQDRNGLFCPYPLGRTNQGDPNEILDLLYWSNGCKKSDRQVLFLTGLEYENQNMGMKQLQSNSARYNWLGNKNLSLHYPERANILDQNVQRLWDNSIPLSELACGLERYKNLSNKKLSALILDSCVSSTIENLAELKEGANTVVYSSDFPSTQNLNPSSAYKNLIDELGVMSDQYIAKTFVNSYEPCSKHDTSIAINLDSSSFNKAIDNFKTISNGLEKWLLETSSNKEKLSDIINEIQAKNALSGYSSHADLGLLLGEINSLKEIPKTLKAVCKRFLNNINSSIISCQSYTKSDGKMGLNVYIPNEIEEYLYNRPNYIRSRFNSLTGWNKVLDILYLEDENKTEDKPQFSEIESSIV